MLIPVAVVAAMASASIAFGFQILITMLCGFKILDISIGSGRQRAVINIGGCSVRFAGLSARPAMNVSTSQRRWYRLRSALRIGIPPFMPLLLAGAVSPAFQSGFWSAVWPAVVFGCAIFLIIELDPRAKWAPPTPGRQLVNLRSLSSEIVQLRVEYHDTIKPVGAIDRALAAGKNDVAISLAKDLAAQRPQLPVAWLLGSSAALSDGRLGLAREMAEEGLRVAAAQAGSPFLPEAESSVAYLIALAGPEAELVRAEGLVGDARLTSHSYLEIKAHLAVRARRGDPAAEMALQPRLLRQRGHARLETFRLLVEVVLRCGDVDRALRLATEALAVAGRVVPPVLEPVRLRLGAALAVRLVEHGQALPAPGGADALLHLWALGAWFEHANASELERLALELGMSRAKMPTLDQRLRTHVEQLTP